MPRYLTYIFILVIISLFAYLQFALVEKHDTIHLDETESELKRNSAEISQLKEELQQNQQELQRLEEEIKKTQELLKQRSGDTVDFRRDPSDPSLPYVNLDEIQIDNMKNTGPTIPGPLPPDEIWQRCDPANIKAIAVQDFTFYDVFAMNWESEVGFVAPTRGDPRLNWSCKFGTDVTRLENQPVGYLNGAFLKCTIPEKAKAALQKEKYLEFELIDSQSQETLGNIVVCVSREPKSYYTANCCIYRNDDNILKQWLEWNTRMGMEHYILYDHLSTDASNKVLAPYIKAGRVTYTNWRNYRPEPHNIDTYHVAQDTQLLSCINRYRDKVKWLWLGDTDEFIYPQHADNFLQLLKDKENDPSIQGVRFHGWRMTDDVNNPLPLIADPTGQTTLIEPYPLNKTFVEKYQWMSTRYSTFKVFAKLPDAKWSAIHDMASGGSTFDYSDDIVVFLHYRFERYGRADNPGDQPKYFPDAQRRFGKFIKPWYPPK